MTSPTRAKGIPNDSGTQPGHVRSSQGNLPSTAPGNDVSMRLTAYGHPVNGLK